MKPERCAYCGDMVDIPFECTYCKDPFCDEHRLPEDHRCVKLTVIRAKKFGEKKVIRDGGPVLVNSKNFLENFVNQYSALVGSSFERRAWKNNVTANASITTIDIHNGSTCVWPSRVTIIAGATT